MSPDRTPDRPSTEAAAKQDPNPATGTAGTSKLGGSPGSVSIDDAEASDRRLHTQDAAVTAADHDMFWRKSFADQNYTDQGRGYEHYRPAYQFGWESQGQYGDRAFDDAEAELREQWGRRSTQLTWAQARPAVRDAFTRASNTDASTPGNPLA